MVSESDAEGDSDKDPDFVPPIESPEFSEEPKNTTKRFKVDKSKMKMQESMPSRLLQSAPEFPTFTKVKPSLQMSRKVKFNDLETSLLYQMFEDYLQPGGAKLKSKNIKDRLATNAGKPLRKYNIAQINTRLRYLRSKILSSNEE